MSVRLEYGTDDVGLEVRDFGGRGTPGELAKSGSGCLLLGMRERAELLGGTLESGSDRAVFVARLRVPACLPALQAGARGYLTKDVDGDELVRAIDDVLSGEAGLRPGSSKAGLRDRAQAIHYVCRHGLAQPPGQPIT